jgi:hypothetical protein
MMSEITNDYDKLFDYLEYHKKSSEREKKKSSLSEVQKEKQKQKIAQETKKLLEESEIHSYIPGKIPNRSTGFNVDKFENLMRTKLIDDHKKLQTYERPYISVSELYSCLRKSYYTRLRYPVDIKEQFRFAYLYLIQKIGNEIHSVVQELYDFTEIEKTIVSEKYKVKGRIDGIKESYLYEIKSVDIGKVQNGYIKEHFDQANIYAYILNSEYGYELEKVTLVYVQRDLKRIIPFDISINNSQAKSFLNRSPLLLKAINNHEVIDPIGANEEQCKYCLYKKYCQKDKCQTLKQPFIKEKKVKPKKVEKEDLDYKQTAFLL